MGVATFTIWKDDDDTYVVEMTSDVGAVSIHVPVPKEGSGRLYSESEREGLAFVAAQRLAMEFLTRSLTDSDKRRH